MEGDKRDSEDVKMRKSGQGYFGVEFCVYPLDLGGKRDVFEDASVSQPLPA